MVGAEALIGEVAGASEWSVEEVIAGLGKLEAVCAPITSEARELRYLTNPSMAALWNISTKPADRQCALPKHGPHNLSMF